MVSRSHIRACNSLWPPSLSAGVVETVHDLFVGLLAFRHPRTVVRGNTVKHRWKAIRQAQPQGLSMRMTARLVGLSHVTVSNHSHRADTTLKSADALAHHPTRGATLAT